MSETIKFNDDKYLDTSAVYDTTIADDLSGILSNLFPLIISKAHYIETAFDYNSLTTPGVYQLEGAGPYSCTNGPSESCTNCYVFVFGNANRTKQLITPGNNEYAYYRSMVTDTSNWRSWKQI